MAPRPRDGPGDRPAVPPLPPHGPGGARPHARQASGELTEQDEAHLEDMVRRVVNKLLHNPVQVLRQGPAAGATRRPAVTCTRSRSCSRWATGWKASRRPRTRPPARTTPPLPASSPPAETWTAPVTPPPARRDRVRGPAAWHVPGNKIRKLAHAARMTPVATPASRGPSRGVLLAACALLCRGRRIRLRRERVGRRCCTACWSTGPCSSPGSRAPRAPAPRSCCFCPCPTNGSESPRKTHRARPSAAPRHRGRPRAGIFSLATLGLGLAGWLNRGTAIGLLAAGAMLGLVRADPFPRMASTATTRGDAVRDWLRAPAALRRGSGSRRCRSSGSRSWRRCCRRG